MTTYTSAVEISHLRKTYGNLVAVDDVSVSVAEGEIFGILGPNGAGKTTAIECAVGLRRPDAGTIRLLGLDPHADRDTIHEIVGVQLQTTAFPAKLRVGEILEMYRSFYRRPADVSELVEALGLAGKLRDYYRSLSGGQRQRLSVALALIGRPKIAVLDEMTTGLDPQARRDTWELIEHIRDRGTTILLVTHFMEEAERLCDHVALIDHGRIVALDTPAGLTARARGGKTVRFLPSAPFDERLLTGLPEVSGSSATASSGGDRDRRARQRGAVRPARGRAGGAGRAAGRLHAWRTPSSRSPARACTSNRRRTQGRSTGMSLHTLTAPRRAARRVRQDRPERGAARRASARRDRRRHRAFPAAPGHLRQHPGLPADQRAPRRPVRVRGLHPDPDLVLDRRARADLPARPAGLVPGAGHPAPPVDHAGARLLGAGRAVRRPGMPDADRGVPAHRRERGRLRGDRAEEPGRPGAGARAVPSPRCSRSACRSRRRPGPRAPPAPSWRWPSTR